MKFCFFFILIFLIFLFCSSCVNLPALKLIDFYQKDLKHLSAVRDSQCPMYPSCSEYSKESFKKHGFIMGFIMTFDRLIRCGGDEIELSSPIIINNQIKCFDEGKK